MSFAGDKNYITFMRHHTSSTDSLAPINNCNGTLQVISINTSDHFVYYLLWLFTTRIIGSKYYPGTKFCCNFTHHRSFCFITISTSSNNSNQLPPCIHDLINCCQYILQCVRSMSIIYNCCNVIFRSQIFKSPFNST